MQVRVLKFFTILPILTAFGILFCQTAQSEQSKDMHALPQVDSPSSNSGDNGGTAAGNEQFDAMVVLVFDDSCGKWCNLVKPIMKDLQGKYANVRFVEINASPSVIKEAKKTAKQLKIDNFLAATTDNIPEVGVFTHKAEKGPKLQKELVGLKGKDVYVSAIEHALGK